MPSPKIASRLYAFNNADIPDIFIRTARPVALDRLEDHVGDARGFIEDVEEVAPRNARHRFGLFRREADDLAEVGALEAGPRKLVHLARDLDLGPRVHHPELSPEDLIHLA